MQTIQFVLKPDGEITCIYADVLAELISEGEASIKRASHVEPAEDGSGWTADLSPVGGPVLPSCTLRADALKAEVDWLNANYL